MNGHVFVAHAASTAFTAAVVVAFANRIRRFTFCYTKLIAYVSSNIIALSLRVFQSTSDYLSLNAFNFNRKRIAFIV